MNQPIRPDQFLIDRIKTTVFNGWTYTMQETCEGVRVGVRDPRGVFYGYVTMPGRNAPTVR